MNNHITNFFLFLSLLLFGMTPMGYAVSNASEFNNSKCVTRYHYDNLGNTVALTNGGGVIKERIEYSPHGAITHRERMPGFSSALHDTPYLFVGQFGVQADGTGLLYMRARYYNPLLMRFINADPAGFAGGANWYAYAGGNPLRFIDPSGFAPGSIGSEFTSFLSKAVEYIPLLGNLLQAECAFNTGNYTQAAIYTGLAVLDVAPPVKLTTTTAKVAMVTTATYRTASTAGKVAPVINISRFSQLREASTFLRDEAGVSSSAYRRQVIESFGRDMHVGTFQGQAYQYSGAAGTYSRYLTPTPLANPIHELALPPSNPAILIQQYSVNPTRALMGTVSPQNFGFPLSGGAQQLFIPSRSVLSPTPLLP